MRSQTTILWEAACHRANLSERTSGVLVEVVRGESELWRVDAQLGDIAHSDVNHLVDVLERAFDQQYLAVRYDGAVQFVAVGINNGVAYSGLVFERKEDEAVCCSWSLSGDDATSDEGLGSVADVAQVVGRKNVHAFQFAAAMRHRMTANRHSGAPVIRHHPLDRTHPFQW